jgi:hypothetical protein
LDSNNATDWYLHELTVHVDSHLFIWNWGTNTAAILINSDDPPQQTRSYSTDIQFSTPAARRYPVAFGARATSVDLSVDGVIVDEYASYQSAEPLPPFTGIDDIKRLVSLTGEGIHPVYRTPYGDWYHVGIESVDVSKSKLWLYEAKVKQRAVED